MKYRSFSVPPTSTMGSYKGVCTNSHMESYEENALWDYNKAREHDGLRPLSKLPKGTQFGQESGARTLNSTL